jgi:hypothetical protein
MLTRKQKLREILFILGIGFLAAYYVIMCSVFIIAFTRGGMVLVNINASGEGPLEFTMTAFSIPIVIFAMKNVIDIHKDNLKRGEVK